MSSLSADTQDMNLPEGIYLYRAGYCFRPYVTDVETGVRKQIRVSGFDTPEAASLARMKFTVGMSDGTLSAPSQITVDQWFDKWLEAGKDQWKWTTYTSHKDTVDRRIRPYLGHMKLQSVSEDDIRRMFRVLVAKGYATNTLTNVFRRLRTAFRAAVRERRIAYSPVANVQLPKGKAPKKRNTWTFDELMKFSEYTSHERDAAMWAFWITTGLRRGEMCGLFWSKVDLEAGEALIDWQRTCDADGKPVEDTVKTAAGERVVPLSSRVVDILRTWKAAQSAIRLTQGPDWQGGDYVFTTARSAAYNPGSFNGRLTDLAERAGVRGITPHELRHTFGTRAVEAGMEIKVLSTLMGHSKIQVTYDLYIHPNREQQKQAAAAVTARMFG